MFFIKISLLGSKIRPGVGKLRAKWHACEHVLYKWHAARKRRFCGPRACKCGPQTKLYF